MDLVEIVAERTGMSQERAKIYVEMAKQRALAHTNRTVYITAMDFCVADLACAMYFRGHGRRIITFRRWHHIYFSVFHL